MSNEPTLAMKIAEAEVLRAEARVERAAAKRALENPWEGEGNEEVMAAHDLHMAKSVLLDTQADWVMEQAGAVSGGWNLALLKTAKTVTEEFFGPDSWHDPRPGRCAGCRQCRPDRFPDPTEEDVRKALVDADQGAPETCPHGVTVWPGHECGECEMEGGKS